jgi:pimeloyl-ACP methyl ester carboxylesterase
VSDPADAVHEYDEFGLFHENIAEFDLDVDEVPPVVRIDTSVPDGDGGSRTVSALRWGSGDPELVLVHGGAQNAHTWDTVALALGDRCWRSTFPATATPTGATTAPTAR